MRRTLRARHLSVLLLFLTGLAACNLPEDAQVLTETLSVTQAYQTVEARLTQAAESPAATTQPAPTTGAPDETPSPASPTSTPPAAATDTVPPDTPTPTIVCALAAPGNPIDVTIPDDTEVEPEESFTKIWRLQNIGSCTWDQTYTVELFSGERMGASRSLPLSNEVHPGESVEIAIDMTAPEEPGTYQGNWKLRTPSGDWFGIGPSGSAPFWVRIIVIPTSTPTSVATETETPTPTSTPTQDVQAVGEIILSLGDRVNLDDLQAESDEGVDMMYEPGQAGQHRLAPLSGARLGQPAVEAPSLDDCRAAEVSDEPLLVENLALDIYFCYHTDLGLPGRAHVLNLHPDFSLTLDILTWSLP